MKKTIFISALLASGVCSNVSASLVSNAVLDFDDGDFFCEAGADPTNGTGCLYSATNVTGSYFAFDYSGNGVIDNREKIALTSAGTGITIGRAQGIGEIDQSWFFGGNLGNNYTRQGPTLISASGNTASLDMAAWTIYWNGEDTGVFYNRDELGKLSQDNLVATIICNIDCSVGDSFTLTYSALLATSGCGFGCLLEYELYLEGAIASPVPVPSAVWLFGSGLMVLVGFARGRLAQTV